jgi:choline dehydrogenase-like flavoprotein
VTARKEVVLSAGAIGTPQLLMLSGIGDREALKAHSIKSVVHLPDVGQHLQDHPIVSNYWTVSSNHTLDDVYRNPDIYNADMERWITNKTGVFADTPGNTIAYLRIPDDDPIWQNYTDPTAGE